MTVPNRIAVAPMCQYSADDGSPTDWHLQHWMSMGMSQAGMVTVEATGVERRGRITHGCLGLYSDDNEAGIACAARGGAARLAEGDPLRHPARPCRAQGLDPRPWQGGRPLGPDEDPGRPSRPRRFPSGPGWHVPEPLDEAGIDRIIGAFRRRRRSARSGPASTSSRCTAPTAT